MTKRDSCKTCSYFDSKDWDSDTKNWCRYNDLPAIDEGLCGHYEPLIKSCPLCKGRVELRPKMDGSAETYFFLCTKCFMWFEKFVYRARDPKDIIEDWNTRVDE